MNRTKLRLLLVLAALVFAVLFLFLFKIDKNKLVSSHPKNGMDNLKTARVFNFDQRFKVKDGQKRFNTISVAVYNPDNKPVVCRFFLRTKKNGKLIFQGNIRLPKNTVRFNTETISFPPVNSSRRGIFHFELNSNKAFNVLVYSGSPHSNQDNLLFRVSDQQRLSLISYTAQITNPNTRAICFFLIICAAAGLISAGFALGSGNNRRNFIFVIVLLAVFIFSIICVSFFVGNNTHARLLGAEDDAYITYKYAQNIVAGKGFTFNPDEKTLGTTTPLYTLTLALFGALVGNIHVLSLLLCFASILGSAIFIYLILEKHFSSLIALSGGIIFLFFPMFYRVLGMETNLLIFLIITSLYFFSRNKTNPAFFILGLAVITRMETLIIPPILILVLLYKKKFRQLLTGTGIFLLTIMPWFIFSYYYFGNLLPNTFYAKTGALQAQNSPLPRIGHLIPRILKLKFLKSLFLNSFGSYLPDYIQSYFTWLFLFAAALLTSFKSLLRISFFRLYIFWVSLYIFALSVLNVSPFIWYYVLPLSVIPIVLPVGLSRLKGKIGRFIAVMTVIGLALFGGRNIYNIFYSHWYTQHMSNLERYITFENIAEYIQDNIPVENSIAMEEIGIVAYGIDNKIWDVYCLIHNTSHFPAGYSTPGHQRIPSLLKYMQPDYILFHSGRLAQSIDYSQDYLPIKFFPVNSFALKPAFFYVLMKSKK